MASFKIDGLIATPARLNAAQSHRNAPLARYAQTTLMATLPGRACTSHFKQLEVSTHPCDRFMVRPGHRVLRI